MIHEGLPVYICSYSGGDRPQVGIKTLITISCIPLYLEVASCVYVGEAGGPDYVTIEHGAFIKDSTVAHQADRYCSRYGRIPVLMQGGETETTKFRCVDPLRAPKTTAD